MTWLRATFAAVALLCGGSAHAEQSVTFGDLEVHYVLLASTFIEPDVAQRYGIVRARDQGLVNLTVLSGSGEPRAAHVTGALVNLLGQRIELDFREIRDGTAIYYLAPFRYTDAEFLRFEIDVDTPNEGGGALHFEQRLYWD